MNVNAQAFRYLKWEEVVVGIIHDDLSVTFIDPAYNTTVKLCSQGKSHWSPDEFLSFLSDRIMSPNRRDIEKLLFRCGLSEYDTFRIADATHAVNPRDQFWIAQNASDQFANATTDVFESIFLNRIDAQGDSVNTPEGFNEKRYAALNGSYGIVKKRISPLSCDVESEVAVYLLAREMNVPCCRVQRFDADSVFSEFEYDFTREYIVHMRRLFNGPRGENELDNLLAVRPQYADDFYRMIALDFVTRQDDRHLSNMALKITEEGESFYPLYDNGRSLFYEDTERMAFEAANDPATYSTTFGYVGTYWDHLQDIAAKGVNLSLLVNLDISESTIARILTEAGFESYRFEAAGEWISRSLELIKSLG